MTSEHEHADAVQRPFIASEAHECKQHAEDPQLSGAERLVWATLAVAAELHIIRKELRRKR